MTTPSRPRTRFDRSRRNTVLVMAGLVIVLAAAGVVGLILTRGNQTKRSTAAVPRYIDLWAIEPDQELRTVTIFFPPEDVPDPSVFVAGPLYADEQDVMSSEPFGGAVLAEETLHGPGEDSILFYQRYELENTGDGEPYGLVTHLIDSPYHAVELPNTAAGTISLGIKANDGYYKQVITAVAFPEGTTIDEISGLQPYREAVVKGWQVYYFDVTDASTADTIRISYTLPEETEDPELDYWQIDLQR